MGQAERTCVMTGGEPLRGILALSMPLSSQWLSEDVELQWSAWCSAWSSEICKIRSSSNCPRSSSHGPCTPLSQPANLVVTPLTLYAQAKLIFSRRTGNMSQTVRRISVYDQISMAFVCKLAWQPDGFITCTKERGSRDSSGSSHGTSPILGSRFEGEPIYGFFC